MIQPARHLGIEFTIYNIQYHIINLDGGWCDSKTIRWLVITMTHNTSISDNSQWETDTSATILFTILLRRPNWVVKYSNCNDYKPVKAAG